jgi:hypothetical protein
MKRVGVRGIKYKQKSSHAKTGLECAAISLLTLFMRNLKFLALCGLLAAAASPFFGPAQAQIASVADIKATAEALQTLQDQQKTITDNQGKIDDKLASIAENVRQARLFASRAK